MIVRLSPLFCQDALEVARLRAADERAGKRTNTRDHHPDPVAREYGCIRAEKAVSQVLDVPYVLSVDPMTGPVDVWFGRIGIGVRHRSKPGEPMMNQEDQRWSVDVGVLVYSTPDETEMDVVGGTTLIPRRWPHRDVFIWDNLPKAARFIKPEELTPWEQLVIEMYARQEQTG